jgi:branched-chain amino acid aminotransferase
MIPGAKVWIDGAVVDGALARVSVFDHGLLYGDGIFEGMRVYSGRVFRRSDHLRRLAVSAKAIGLVFPDDVDLEAVIDDTVAAFGKDDAYIRLLVTRGEGPLSVDPTKCTRSRVICIIGEVSLYPAEKLEAGVDVVTVSLRRPRPDVLEPRVKSLNYLNNALAILEARRAGADEALLLNEDGCVAEASGANVFTVRDGVVATPPTTDGALEGVTRRTLLEVCARDGFPAEERRMTRIDLLAADEVFLVGTGARMVPVRTLDGALIGTPRAVAPATGSPEAPHRPIYARLSAAYEACVRAHDGESC